MNLAFVTTTLLSIISAVTFIPYTATGRVLTLRKFVTSFAHLSVFRLTTELLILGTLLTVEVNVAVERIQVPLQGGGIKLWGPKFLVIAKLKL